MRTTPARTVTITPTEAAILGLLSQHEASGYDLLKAARRSVGYFWTPAKSQLYAVLPRLVEAGLASSRTVRQSAKPDKQLYRITRAGAAALRDWVNSPAPPEPDRNPLLLQLFFGEHGDVETILEHVRMRRHQLEELEGDLSRLDVDSPNKDAFFPSTTRRYGHAYARALIAWAREVETDLTKRIEG